MGKRASSSRSGSGNKKSGPKRLVPSDSGQTSEPGCDCPLCTGELPDSRGEVDAILANIAKITDALEAEVIGSLFLAAVGAFTAEPGPDLDNQDHDDLDPAVSAVAFDALVEGFESTGGDTAAGMLAVLGTVGAGPVARSASAYLARLVERGASLPTWAEALSAPVTAHDCVAVTEPEVGDLVLAGCFERAGTEHAMMVLLDPRECGAAVGILLLSRADLPKALATVRRDARRNGLRLIEEALDPAEFRWRAEVAMAVRDDHDQEDAGQFAAAAGVDGAEYPFDELDDEDETTGYPELAPLLQARLRALPASTKPKPPHGNDEFSTDPELFADLLADVQRLSSGAANTGRFGGAPSRRTGPKLPPKRKTRDGKAPILQLRVDLRGARPPIWRRLEVAGDIPLNELHEVLQHAFEWEFCHLHVFETVYGAFGRADGDLGYRADESATLEQVAAVGEKLTYTYDFGDDWEHVIVVERSLPRDPAATYPRCTGGRRAAPPEDCGGIYGYERLLEILADPTHEEHAQQLEWFGLERADEFDPAKFDLRVINESLAALA